jgi:hypothetical protein
MIQYDFQRIPCLPWNKYKFRITIDILILINKIKKLKCQELFITKNVQKIMSCMQSFRLVGKLKEQSFSIV